MAARSVRRRRKRRRPVRASRFPTVAGAGCAVVYAWGIAPTRRAAAKSATRSSPVTRRAIKKIGTTDRAPKIGTRRFSTVGRSRPERWASPPCRKNVPGKYGYVTPHPSYIVETWPVRTRSRRIAKYSPVSEPQYRKDQRGMSRTAIEPRTRAVRPQAVDFLIHRQTHARY